MAWLALSLLAGFLRTNSGILISRNLGEPDRLENQAEFGSGVGRFRGGQFGAEMFQDLAVGHGCQGVHPDGENFVFF